MTAAAPSFLALCRAFYERLSHHADRLHQCGQHGALLEHIECMAAFAASHHPGWFVDGGVENFALEVGNDLDQLVKNRVLPGGGSQSHPEGHEGSRHVLHVATAIYGVGGLLRTIVHWIETDRTSRHSVALTRQGDVQVPASLRRAVKAGGGAIHQAPRELHPLARASWLRDLGRRVGRGPIVLHQNPDDVIPLVAFAVPGEAPVAYLNHADHIYWLGAAVSDVVINLREPGEILSVQRRMMQRSVSLPIPLEEDTRGPSRVEARRQLQIGESEVVLLSVGRSVKYVPSKDQSFYRAARLILERHPLARLFLVGVGERDHAHLDGYYTHERMHFVGPIDDPIVYQRAADVYVEGFPFGSQTAVLESILPGVPAVLAVAQLSPLLATHDPAISDLLRAPASEAAYVDEVSRYIDDVDLRRHVGQQLSDAVRAYHTGDNWHRSLQTFYAALSDMRHVARVLPREASQSDVVDQAVSEWHQTKYGDRGWEKGMSAFVRNRLAYGAYWLREAGDYSGAQALLRVSRLEYGTDWRGLMEAAKVAACQILGRRRSPGRALD